MMRYTRAFLLACLFGILLSASAMAQRPQVQIDGDRFKINGTAKFLTFVSYYDGWRAPQLGPCTDPNATSVECDLKWLKQIGFDGVRVFPNWIMAQDLSYPPEPHDYWFWNDTVFGLSGLRSASLERLKQFIDAAGAAGLAVDLTFTRDGICGAAPIRVLECPDEQRMSFASYKARVVEIMTSLKDDPDPNRYSHVIIDLQNERNLCGPLYQFQCMDDYQLKELVTAARNAGGPLGNRLSASMTTPSMIGIENVASAVKSAQLNIADWHDPRDEVWFSETESRVGQLKQHLAQLGVPVPISLQETTPWQEDPNANHMKTAAQGAKKACAASWTFHTRTAFNLTNSSFRQRLEFDPPQKQALEQLKAAVDAVSWGCPPPPQQPTRAVVIDLPIGGQTIPQPFILGGWAIDETSPTGTGVDIVHVYAYNAANVPFFCGASYWQPRPDIAAIYGPRFLNSGFSMIVRGLPQDNYRFVAYARSTVCNDFCITKVTPNVTVKANPVLAIDAPAADSTVLHNFVLAGWAIDFGAAGGTGVDTIHVWAYREGSPETRFVGVAPYGADRPDVAAIYGGQFLNSGYNMLVTTLPAGTWNVAVFPHGTVNNSFFPATLRRITVLQ